MQRLTRDEKRWVQGYFLLSCFFFLAGIGMLVLGIVLNQPSHYSAMGHLVTTASVVLLVGMYISSLHRIARLERRLDEKDEQARRTHLTRTFGGDEP